MATPKKRGKEPQINTDGHGYTGKMAGKSI
jgi:hypothetical protein